MAVETRAATASRTVVFHMQLSNLHLRMSQGALPGTELGAGVSSEAAPAPVVNPGEGQLHHGINVGGQP